MGVGEIGIWTSQFDFQPAAKLRKAAADLEKLGFGAIWFPESVGREAFTHAGLILSATKRIVVATGIANIYARDPVTAAAAQKSLAEAYPGRFLLGLGVSHIPLVEEVRGHTYGKPVPAMMDRLDYEYETRGGRSFPNLKKKPSEYVKDCPVYVTCEPEETSLAFVTQVIGAERIMQNWVRWPLEWHYGLDTVGIYSVGSSIGSALGILTGAFISAWTPYALSHADRQAEAVQVLGRITLYYVAGFGFLTCLFFLYATPVVQIFAKPAFHGATGVVGLSALAQFLSTLFLMLLPPLYFAQRVGNVLVSQGVATIIVFLLASILVPSFGITGAAITVVLSYSALVAVQWACLQYMPVLRIHYDYRRAGLLFLVFSSVAALSFIISFAEPVRGFALAGVAALVTAAIVFRGICRMPDVWRVWQSVM